MKRLFFLMSAIFVLSGIAILNSCEQSDNNTANTAKGDVTMAKAQTVKLNVEGMSCGSCVNHIETALAKQDGVIKSKVTLAENSCEVEFDAAKTNTDEILATIDKAGYSASVAQ